MTDLLGRDDLPFPLNRPLTGQDLLQFIERVLQPLRERANEAVVPFTGTVTGFATQPRTVTVATADGDVVARYYTGYTPHVGDTVEGLQNAATARVLGVLA